MSELNSNNESQLPLAPYRVLDLTDEKGMFCGRILGDLGAEVIKVEEPGGDQSRNIGPFYHDIPHPEKSLPWFAYNANKKGITLNLRSSDGREIFKRLAKTADFVIESFAPGYLDNLELGYPTLSQVNPRIILVSITPFGQSGPYKDYKASDIVSVAMGGLMYVTGDPDRPPVRVSVEQSHLHAGAQAAIGSLLALHHRTLTGEGQIVDVSIQESMIPAIPELLSHWEFGQRKVPRSGPYVFRGEAWQRATWPCKDGQIGMRILTGVYAKAIIPLVEWMDEEGMAGNLKQVKWEEIDVGQLTQEEYDSWEDQFMKFFLRHTKEDLYREAVKRGIHLLPAYAPDELLTDRQLLSRNFWVDVEHPELGANITYPGPAARLSATPLGIRRHSPLIGEHNQDIYGELGISAKELVTLKESGII
ncbi:MAG: CaiB/BaiF CoA-transferase family protein [Dehalococcoidia bacterium]|nr:CaiB/BaiF CoA-transferase family protein [Dehalococcoidia bacterium]